ncbi:MAG TPA: hypothetical protein VJL78_00580 [Candidatus Nitrosocosmicus sp.]|nr:hypothetical protein [Candidatus Nitrosocosmicus sp.]
MNKSNMQTKIEDKVNAIRLYIYSIPKKNHDAMMHNQSQFDETFHKHGILGYKTLQLNRSDDSEGFVSLSTLISSNKDEEIWLDLEQYKNNDHLNDVGNRMEHDKDGVNLMKEFINLVSPNSKIIKADFSNA